jgi:hypothetical protein
VGSDPGAVPIRHFAVARLDTDANCNDGNPLTRDLGCYDVNFGPLGPTDKDPGRLWFDGGTDGQHNEGRVHGLQLATNGDGTFDILIAGSDQVGASDDRDFFVARINHDGRNGTAGECGQHTSQNVCEWATLIDFPGIFPPFLVRDDIAWDLVLNPDDPEVIVAGITCESICDPSDVTPGSNIAFARLDATNGNLVYQRHVTGGTGALGSTHTDVAYSVVLQPQVAPFPPLIVIGGYSADSNGGIPYMSGVRFVYDNPNPDAYELFKSFWTDTAGVNGDQAWELDIQRDNNIVAGGFHTRTGPMGDNPAFAAIRLCEDADGDPCGDGAPPPYSGDNGKGSQGPTPDTRLDSQPANSAPGRHDIETLEAGATMPDIAHDVMPVTSHRKESIDTAFALPIGLRWEDEALA